jgi:hypothetical protein
MVSGLLFIFSFQAIIFTFREGFYGSFVSVGFIGFNVLFTGGNVVYQGIFLAREVVNKL